MVSHGAKYAARPAAHASPWPCRYMELKAPPLVGGRCKGRARRCVSLWGCIGQGVAVCAPLPAVAVELALPFGDQGVGTRMAPSVAASFV